jgi:hypothetical protein
MTERDRERFEQLRRECPSVLWFIDATDDSLDFSEVRGPFWMPIPAHDEKPTPVVNFAALRVE